MGVVVNTVKQFSSTSDTLVQSKSMFSNQGALTPKIAEQSLINIDMGSKSCIVTSELQNMLQGIEQGDFKYFALNAGLLAFVACPMMGSAASSKNMYSLGAMSSSNTGGVLYLGSKYSLNNTINNGGSNSQQSQISGEQQDNMNQGCSLTLNAMDDEETSNDGGQKKKGKKTLQEIRKEKLQKMEAKNQVKPKRPLSSYFFFSIEDRKKIMQEHPELKFKGIAQKISADWKLLTPEDKKPYEEMVKKDRIRYEAELKQLNELGYFINKNGIKSTELDKKGKVRNFPEGTVMPKKCRSGYMYYFVECQQARKKEAGEGKVNVTQVTREISTKWNAFTAEGKQKYTDLHDKDQIRYDGQMKALKDNGFFMTEDGQKSTDLPPPKKKKTKKEKLKLKAEMEKAVAEKKMEKERARAKSDKMKAKDQANRMKAKKQRSNSNKSERSAKKQKVDQTEEESSEE